MDMLALSSSVVVGAMAVFWPYQRNILTVYVAVGVSEEGCCGVW